jgi:hypothetical protein
MRIGHPHDPHSNKLAAAVTSCPPGGSRLLRTFEDLTLSIEAHPTPVPAPERIAHDRRTRADALFADMLREECSSYVLGLRARAALWGGR